MVLLQRVASFPPQPQAVAAGLDGEGGGGDGGVVGQRFFQAEQLCVGDLVGSIAQDVPLPLGIGLGPVRGQPVGLVLREAGVGLHQAPGHAVHAVIGLERHFTALQRLELVHPLGRARRGLGGFVVGHAKAFQIDQAANAPGPRTGVEHDYVAPHAVAHQVHGSVGRVVVEQLVEVGQVVWKKIMVGR